MMFAAMRLHVIAMPTTARRLCAALGSLNRTAFLHETMHRSILRSPCISTSRQRYLSTSTPPSSSSSSSPPSRPTMTPSSTKTTPRLQDNVATKAAVERAKRARIMTFSNALSLGRVLATPAIAYLLVVRHDHAASAILIVVASLTDFIDGYVARTFDQITDLGTMLDPLADKLLVATLTVSLLCAGLLQPFVAAIILARDALLTAATSVFRYVTLRAQFDRTAASNGVKAPRITLRAFFDLSRLGQQVSPPLISKINTFLQLTVLAALVALPLLIGSNMIMGTNTDVKDTNSEESVLCSNIHAVTRFVALGMFARMRSMLMPTVSPPATRTEFENEYWALAANEVHQKLVVELVDGVDVRGVHHTHVERVFCADAGPNAQWTLSQTLFGEPDDAIVRAVKRVMVSNSPQDANASATVAAEGPYKQRRLAIVSVHDAQGIHVDCVLDAQQTARVLLLEQVLGTLVSAVLCTTVLSAAKYAVDGRRLLRAAP